ncbi:MAG: hypothetical protein JSV65_06825, partial [Armatimonadota bacterium]
MRNRLCILWVLAGLLTAGLASASQVPGHVYVALNAYQRAPARVKAIIEKHWDSYLVGSMGPDMGTTAYLVAQAFDVEHPGSEAHYTKTGRLVANLFREAAKLGYRRVLMQILGAGGVEVEGGDGGGLAYRARTFPERFSFIQIVRAFADWLGSQRKGELKLTIHLVAAPVYREIASGRLDVLELLSC